MPTVYGQPAVTVTDPDGTDSPYVCRAVPAQGKEWKAFELVKEDGTIYRVSEYPTGRFTCTCSAFKFDRGGKGRRYTVGTQRVCKHAFSIAHERPEVGTDEQHRPAGAGVPGEAGRLPGARSG